eukprot:3860165-Prymnesium_polylepis.1
MYEAEPPVGAARHSLITYALLSPPPGRSPWAPVHRVDRYGIGVDPSKRSAPVSPSAAMAGSIRELSGHCITHADRRGW